MDAFHSMALGLQVAVQPTNLFLCFVGVFVGVLVGVRVGVFVGVFVAVAVSLISGLVPIVDALRISPAMAFRKVV